MRVLVGLILLCFATSVVGQEKQRKSVVAVAGNRNAITAFRANQEAVQNMVDAVVMEVAGKSEIGEAWRQFVKPNERVGIKVCAEGDRFFSTHVEVVESIARGLAAAGVPRSNIIVWDRRMVDLEKAGFLASDGGWTVRWADPGGGYDEKAPVAAAAMGRLMWGDLKFKEKKADSPFEKYEEEQLSSTSHIATVLTRDVTKVINVPVLSNARTVGIAGCLYNMAVRNVDNWRRFTQGPAYGDPVIAELYADPRISGKVVLNIMDGLVAQYASGPAFEPNYAFHFGAVYASRDPVAIDATALGLIDRWRREAKLPGALGRGRYIKAAAEMGLGTADPENIDYRVLQDSLVR